MSDTPTIPASTASDDLSALCRVWQERLRLQDWRITVRYVRAWKHDSNLRIGHSEWNPQHRVAWLDILDPVDVEPNPVCAETVDVEQTLVHELVHVMLYPWAPETGTTEHILLEQAVDALAWSLVEAYRRRRYWHRLRDDPEALRDACLALAGDTKTTVPDGAGR